MKLTTAELGAKLSALSKTTRITAKEHPHVLLRILTNQPTDLLSHVRLCVVVSTVEEQLALQDYCKTLEFNANPLLIVALEDPHFVAAVRGHSLVVLPLVSLRKIASCACEEEEAESVPHVEPLTSVKIFDPVLSTETLERTKEEVAKTKEAISAWLEEMDGKISLIRIDHLYHWTEVWYKTVEKR